MALFISKFEMYARLASEARAVLTDVQIEEMAVSMDCSKVEVEELFNNAERVYESVKDRLAKS